MRRAAIKYQVAISLLMLAAASAFGADAPDYSKQIQPLLTKYCTSCHNNDDREGKLSLESYDALLKGGAKGAILTPGHSDLSRMVLMLSGKAQPAMPPKDSDPPTAAEIALLRAWIDAGAKGPSGAAPDPTILVTPQIKVQGLARESINAVAVAPRGNAVAFAKYGEVELQPGVHKLTGHRGNVNAVAFSDDDEWLVAGAGEPGLFGEARIWKVADRSLVKMVQGHRDSVYSVRLSPDRRLLATGGYDGLIILWDTTSGKLLRRLEGHNGAVFELAFRRDGKILASASGDRTVKLWNVETGERLETLKESTKELYSLAFSPRGDRVAAAGVDNRIRVWQVSEDGKEGTNPLLLSQFAHETPVLRLAWSADGETIVSTGEDRLVKVWNAGDVTIRQTLPKQREWASGIAILPDASGVVIGRIDGSTGNEGIAAAPKTAAVNLVAASETPPEVDYGEQPALDKLPKIAEVEPNDVPQQAPELKLPGVVTGLIQANSNQPTDADLFRFHAKQGEQWIFETNAARSGSPLDSKLEILDTAGKPVPRVLLRAVRDTEIEFRGMNSDQRGVRLKNYEEMLLNEYVYLGGEVIKHYQQRRGPDADGNFYPESGNRFTFFETTSRAHALGEPGYMVVPYPVGTQLPNNGLPVFTLYFENDDQSQRKFGKDSQVTFVAPATGDYLVRVSDVRNFHGPQFKYELIARRPQPDFKVTVGGMNPTVSAGSGKTFSVKAERTDNFQGEIRVDITGLPQGFTVTSPVVIPAGLLEAQGAINCAPDAPAPTAENEKSAKLAATAVVAGKERTVDAGTLGIIKRADKPKLIAHLELSSPTDQSNNSAIPELTIVPGGSITCKLRIERSGFADRVAFDVQNLPHGVIVDDIGLSGVLIPEGKLERTIFLRAEPWMADQDRLFHAQANVEGNQVSRPMLLKVRRK